MNIVVSSASGANGTGHGALLAFDLDGTFHGPFSGDDRIADPRGLAVNAQGQLLYVNSGADRLLALNADGQVIHDTGPIAGLNPGGGNWGPDGRYHVGLRSARTIGAFGPELDGPAQKVLPQGIVPFPRGFAFGPDGRLFLASGIGPSGHGDNTICVFNAAGQLESARFVDDPAASPLDLTIAPNTNVIISSEFPFGDLDAECTLREYDGVTGELVRTFRAGRSFRSPRGLRFGPNGLLYCVSRDEVAVFDFADGRYLGPMVTLPRLYGQAIQFFG